MTNLQRYQGKKICVAVSGGADSVALLHYLLANRKQAGYTLLAVHCEHAIRGKASLKDKAFVETLCKRWGVELFIFAEDCPVRAKREKESLETVARNFRRESFEKLVRENKADYIATAHHLNDQTETLLLHLSRGSALSGAVGMQEENGWYVRPLLSWSKEKIICYVKDNNLRYRVDKTNFQTDATRNKLRLRVLPTLRKIFPSLDNNLSRFARLASDDDAYLYALSQKLISRDGDQIVLAHEKEKSLFFRGTVFALKSLGVDKDYTLVHVQSVYDLEGKEKGKILCLPKGVLVENRENCVVFFKAKEDSQPFETKQKTFDLGGFDGGVYEVGFSSQPVESQGKWKTLRMDADALPSDAVFRFRKQGDYIHTFSGNGKSLKKFFNEKKVDKQDRERLPLIASRETGEVYAVCGVEISQNVKIRETTRNAVYIITKEKGESR